MLTAFTDSLMDDCVLNDDEQVRTRERLRSLEELNCHDTCVTLSCPSGTHKLRGSHAPDARRLL